MNKGGDGKRRVQGTGTTTGKRITGAMTGVDHDVVPLYQGTQPAVLAAGHVDDRRAGIVGCAVAARGWAGASR